MTKRLIYLALIVLTIALGLFSRSRFIPSWLYLYLGDFLYTVMYYWIAAFLFPGMKRIKLAMMSIFFCYFIELLQLYQAPWIEAIRETRLGGLILGFGFLWSDIVAYTLGGIFAWFLDKNFFSNQSLSY